MEEMLIRLAAAVVAGALLPYLGGWLVAGYDRLFRDLPYIKGTWETESLLSGQNPNKINWLASGGS